MFCSEDTMLSTSKSIWGFDPRIVPGCCLWLDGNDPAGTGTQPTSGAAVTTWVDKSGSNNSLTAAGTTPTFSNTSPGSVNFGGAGYYSNAAPVLSNVYTAFFVYKQTAGNNGPLYTTADTGGFNGFFGNYNSFGTYLVTSDSGYWSTTTTTPFPFGTTQIATTSYGSNAVGGAVSLYANGSNVVTTTQTGTITYTAFFLGRRAPEILAGTMYEVLAYNSELTTSQRQQVEGYLARRWGLNASLPSTHPFYTIPPFLRTFQPVDIPGCALWLDAADASTFAYSSGSNVSQWTDKSGTTNDAVRGSWGTYPTRTTSNTVLFSNSASSSQYLNTQAGRQTTQAVTWIAVVKVFSVTNGGVVFDQRKELVTGQPLNVVGMTSMISRPAGTNTTVDITYTLPLATTMVIVFQTTLNTEYAYVNGALVGSNLSALSLPSTDTGYTTIGAVTDIPAIISSASQTLYSQAVLEISELMMFNSYLTASQRQQVEGYLSKKWTIGTVVPAFVNPTSISNCTLWLDASGSSNFSFSSGTTIASWIDKSGLGNNATPYTPFSASTTATYSSSCNAVYFPGATGLGTTIAVPTNRVQSGFFVAITSNVSAGALQGCRNGNSREFRNYTNSSLQTLQQNVAALLSSTGTAALSIFAYTDDGTTITHSVNGTATTGTSSTTFDAGTQLTLGISGNNEHIVGYMYEAIIYSSALTSTQRQQVEYYLAQKWGLTTASSFTPTMIPNTLLWFDAADTSTLTNTGSTVNSWTSKGSFTGSATSNAGTATSGLKTLNGKNVVTIAAGAKLAFTTAAPNQARTYFAVSRITERITYAIHGFNAPVYIQYSTSGGGQDWFGGPCFALLPSGAQNFYISQTGVTDKTTSGYVLSPGNGHWAVYTASSSAVAASNSYVSVNGTPITSGGGTSNLASGYPTGSYTRYIGSGGTVGYDLAELIMINGEVTTAQRQQVEYYLANKWGLLTLSTFEPTVISNCLLWLDAADTSTITTSGTQVTQWRNKGTFDGYASNQTGVVTSGTATYNGSNIVQFPSSTQLAITMSIQNQPRAWFAVFRQLYGSTSPAFQIFGGFTSGYDQIAGPDGNTMDEFRNGVAGMVQTTSATTGNNLFRIYNWTNSAASTSSNRIAINGTALTLTTSSLAAGYGTGSLNYVLMSGYAVGADLAELICINAEITVLQRQQIEYYLAQKWGISGPVAPAYYGPSNVAYGPSAVSLAGTVTPVLPTAHPFATRPPATVAQFSPSCIAGCQIWLDAMDTSTVTGTTAVTQWADKSGNARHLSNVSGTTTYASNAITVSNSAMYVLNTVDLTNFTCFVVAKSVSSSNNQSMVVGIPSSGYSSYANTNGFGFYIDATNGGGRANMIPGGRFVSTSYTMSTFYTPSTSTPFIFTGQSPPLSWLNGQPTISQSTVATRTSGAQGFMIGAEWQSTNTYAFGAGWNSSLYEIIVYNVVLTTAQRQTVEAYLAWKWGLQSKLPVTPISAPVTTPTSITGCQIWLDGSDATTVTGTTSVSQWNDKSGNARNMTNVSGTVTYAANAISFSGSYMYVTSAVDLTSVTFFIVSKSSSSASPSMFSGRPNTVPSYGSTDGFSFYIDPGTGGTGGPSSGKGGRFFGEYGGPCFYYTNGTVPFIFSGQITAGTVTGWVNGTPTSTGAIGTRTSTAQGFSVGGEWSGTAYASGASGAWNGSVYEVIVYNTVLTLTQRQSIEAYLAKKWSITYSPTAVNPFRSVSPGFVTLSVAATATYTFPTTSGLVYYLDAGNTSSYPGSGTTWTDLVGSGVAMTLYGSPAYSSAGGGSIVFVPASSQYGATSTSLTSTPNWTIEVWHYYTGVFTGTNACIVTNNYPGTTAYIQFNLGSTSPVTNVIQTAFYNGGWVNNASYTPPTTNTWYHIVGTYNGASLVTYVNGTAVATTATTATALSNTAGFRIMRRWDTSGYADHWGGSLSVFRLYNRGITSTEVGSNFTATRGRFGI